MRPHKKMSAVVIRARVCGNDRRLDAGIWGRFWGQPILKQYPMVAKETDLAIDPGPRADKRA